MAKFAKRGGNLAYSRGNCRKSAALLVSPAVRYGTIGGASGLSRNSFQRQIFYFAETHRHFQLAFVLHAALFYL
jgi:hypothetical protein